MSYQTLLPNNTDVVAVMHTSLGDIKIKLFKNEAPKAVENFTTHAKNGYYDGIIFHRVIKDFMIQGGDPTATGCGGNSIWTHMFEDEFDTRLHNICGALSMANAGPGTNGSQFFIVQSHTCPENMINQMRGLTEQGFPTECVDDYAALGGTPWLDFKHTVFGQVFEGMDVVDKIAAVKVNGADRPLENVVINSIDILNA